MNRLLVTMCVETSTRNLAITFIFWHDLIIIFELWLGVVVVKTKTKN